MLKKFVRITMLISTAFLLCFLLSPTALAAGSNSSCKNNSYISYQGVKQIFGQNVASCQNNTAQEYKITQACPIPPVKNSCKTSVNNCVTKQDTTCTAVKPAQTTKPTQTTKPAQATKPAQTTVTTNVAVSSYAEEVVRLVNVERANNNLAPLTMDKQLNAAAQIRATEATVKFSHTRPNGSSCFSVLSSMGISYRRAGENIAIGQKTPAQVVKAWMDSPGHRANILGDYTKIGVSVVQAGGNFGGYSWAQFFTK